MRGGRAAKEGPQTRPETVSRECPTEQSPVAVRSESLLKGPFAGASSAIVASIAEISVLATLRCLFALLIGEFNRDLHQSAVPADSAACSASSCRCSVPGHLSVGEWDLTPVRTERAGMRAPGVEWRP